MNYSERIREVDDNILEVKYEPSASDINDQWKNDDVCRQMCIEKWNEDNL